MSFTDIFKKSFLEGYVSSDISPKSIAVTLGITCIFALYLFFAYRVFSRKTFYSKNFNISIAMIAVITAAIIMTIQSSIVVSLGMVGALSIVRFRTAIKDPMDLVFLFWSIAVGIICGAGLAAIALVTTVVITIGLIVLDYIPVAKAPVLLVVNGKTGDLEEPVLNCIEQYTKTYTVKSRTLTPERMDLIVELRVAECAKLIQNLAKVEGVTRCSLLSHDGEVTF